MLTSASFKFEPAIFRILSDYAIDFNERLTVDYVEEQLASDSSGNRGAIYIVVALKQRGNHVNILRFERHHHIDVPRHPRLCVVVHRHRAGYHVLDSSLSELLRYPG